VIPLYNLIISVSELVYTFSIAALMSMLIKKGKVAQLTSRKIIHLWLGGLIVFWFLYKPAYGMEYFLVTPLAWIAIMLYAFFSRSNHADLVKVFARRNDINEVIFGPLLFISMFVIFTIVAFRSLAGVAALSAMVFGDGVAPIIGAHAKKHHFNNKKSVVGSISVFIAALISISIFGVVFFTGLGTKFYIIAALVSAIAAVAEAITPQNYDNLTVPVAVYISFFILALII
jgi:dolichol kinase